MKEKILAYYKRYFVYTKEFFKIAEKKNQSWMILALTLVAFIGFGELFILIKGYTSTEILWLYSSVMSSCGSIFALALVVLRKIHSKKSFYVSAFICRFSFFIVLAVETYVAFFYVRNLAGILGWSIICLFALLIFDFEPPLFSSFILTAVISVYFFGRLKGDQATGLVFLGIIYCNLSFIVRKIKIDELRRKEEKRKKNRPTADKNNRCICRYG